MQEVEPEATAATVNVYRRSPPVAAEREVQVSHHGEGCSASMRVGPGNKPPPGPIARAQITGNAGSATSMNPTADASQCFTLEFGGFTLEGSTEVAAAIDTAAVSEVWFVWSVTLCWSRES